MHRKKILFFPFNLMSHYLRCLVLARKYMDDHVCFAASDRYNKFIEREGHMTFKFTHFDTDRVMACARKFDFSWLNGEELEHVFLSQVEAINESSPDLVIGDVAPTLKMAAEKTRVPYLAVMNGYMSPHYAFTRTLTRTHKAYPLLRMLPAPLTDMITRIAEKITFRELHRPFRVLRKKYGLQPLYHFFQEMEGDHNLICDRPELFPQRELPHNYAFTNPLLYTNGSDEKDLLDRLDTTRPTICICMGSSGNWEKLGYFNETRFSRYNIVTAGDTEQQLNAPHIISRLFINLDRVLPRTDVLICHGGNGTINHGLNHRVYMLCLTNHFEQEWNVDALERTGLGKSINGLSSTEIEGILQKTS